MTTKLSPLAGDLTLYARFARPELAAALEAVRLDKHYVRAEGDVMTYRDLDGETVEVLDMLGGYGSTLLGHNHPELVALAQDLLSSNVPFHAQASTRASAGELAWALSERARATTGRDYVVTFASTGAEAIEAAVKHAELERHERHQELEERDERSWAGIVHGRESGDRVAPALVEPLRLALGGRRPPTSLREAHDRLREANTEATAAEPLCIALDDGFHGKTSGALGLTASEHHRGPFAGLLRRTTWIRRGDLAALEQAVASEVRPYRSLARVGDRVVLKEQALCNVSAVFLEPVQGEGGIRPLDPAFLAGVREIADRWDVPVVVDEIQTGLGRCGTFLASSLLGLRGDYYVLGKSLGGGLAKISALLVDARRYRRRFGMLHTSTFAEDDFGCRLALRALEISDRDELPGRAARQGLRLKARLEQLRGRYPDVIADVRGMGLMVGVELAGQERSASNVLRMTSGQHLLGYVVAGYLLNEEAIRVAPALAGASTIRLEPSAYVSDAALERTVTALAKVCEMIRKANAGRLTRCLAGCALPGDRTPVRDHSKPARVYRDDDPATDRKVAFVGHLIDGEYLPLSDPSLGEIPRERLRHYARSTHRLLGPWVLHRTNITSVTGERVHLTFIGLTIPSTVIAEAMKVREVEWLNRRVLEAIAIAEAQGCSVVGLGGYTSIVTNNCKRVANSRLALTSGNALTVGMGIEAIEEAARQRDVDVARSRVAVIGAAGNICSTYARLMAGRASRFLLVGRAGTSERLERVAHQLYADAWATMRKQPEVSAGLAAALRSILPVEQLQVDGVEADVGRYLYERVNRELGEERLVEVAEDMSQLPSCDVVVCASSTPSPIIHAADVSPRPVVICDLSVPSAVDPALGRQCPHAIVIQGGVVRLPRDPDFSIAGIPLAPGHVFACMAETTLLGLAGHRRNYSYGAIDKAQVEAVLELARVHGYRLGQLKQERSY